MRRQVWQSSAIRRYRGRGSGPQAASGMPRRLLPVVKVRLFTKPPYVAGPHPWADKFVPRYLSDGFGQFPFVYGDPLANQFDGSFLIGFVCKKIPHDSRVSLGIESRDPDVPSCWHSHAPQLSSVNDLPYTSPLAGMHVRELFSEPSNCNSRPHCDVTSMMLASISGLFSNSLEIAARNYRSSKG